MKKYALIVAAMSLVLLFTQQDDAHAFNRLGGQQKSPRVVYKLGEVKSEYMSSLSSAMGNWSWGTNNNIKFSQTTNDAIYSAFFQGNYFGDTGWNGLCNNIPHNGAIYTNSVVSMNYTYGDKYDESKKMAIWTHEMGHALGLAHVTDPWQIMCTDADGRMASVPGYDDLNGVRSIYGF
ncbi:matrixin family metalloprotease [Paenibacillus sp. MZ04-78.2]|uniref:matrixin family metalloprotease n=1 Tax=Paenibacillus sp. MZ04-78.2 TaxID=2962034 RepID=UPI0020B6D8C9|nr:matrixin family metalloprotease [Paenibacillus sp. MZ04-78.2]MCP3776580.1 matrixin family metalloprotease [Paenibacillus sp. MZ04-78.2]